MKTLIKKSLIFMVFPIQQITAEVIVDGSLGGAVESLSGPVYEINESLGVRQGGNVFHSFSQFNIHSGEHAKFNAQLNTQNIIARVTGGDSSLINGEISSNSLANLWLLNPAGWIVGSEAKINIQGAFHLSTADGLGFQNNLTYFADPETESVLSLGDPVDYQFNSSQQGAITLDSADLLIADGQAVSLVGGDIELNNAHINAPGGRIILASNAGQGQWRIDADGVTQQQGSGGEITLSHDQAADVFEPTLSSADFDNSKSSGGIQLSAARINMKNAYLAAQSWDDVAAKDTRMTADVIEMDASILNSDVQGDQAGGNVRIEADRLSLRNASRIATSTDFFTTGKGGDISIQVNQRLELSGRSGIESTAAGNDGGNISINSREMVLDGTSRLRLATQGDGHAGNMFVDARAIYLLNDGTLDTASAAADGVGKGGDITIRNVELLKMSGRGLISSASAGAGDAGNISIKTANLEMDNDSKIDAFSQGSGATGQIDIDVGNRFKIDNSRISTLAKVTDGGSIDIASKQLILQQSQVTTSVEGPSGNGGDIDVNTAVLVLDTGFVQANTEAEGGEGGKVDVNAEYTLASRGLILKGGDEQFEFAPDSSVNVIQAAAPEGLSGEVTLSTVELNIAGQLAKVEAGFVEPQTIVDDPCSIDRKDAVSSLVKVGQGGLPEKAGDSINLPLKRYRQPSHQNHEPQSNNAYTTASQVALLSPAICRKEQN